MQNYTIFLDGMLNPTQRLKEQLKDRPAIAADGGIRHAAALGITPLLWIGDFDSTEETLQQKFSAVPQKRFPSEKDNTDGELAVEAALARGAKSLILCGAFGGTRFDHALMHVNSAIALTRQNIHCLLTDGITEGHPLIEGNYQFDLPEGTLFSLIGFSNIEGLTIQGAQWNLENKTLPYGSSLALSNKSCGRVHISIGKGYGILLVQITL